MLVLFLCLKSMPFKRYWHRSEGDKRCHVDNNVVSVTTFWCIALQKHCLRVSYTFDVDVLKMRNLVEHFFTADCYTPLFILECTIADQSCTRVSLYKGKGSSPTY